MLHNKYSMCFSAAVDSLLLAALLVGAITQVGCFNFSYPTFKKENEGDLLLRNSSILFNAIQVTPDVRSSGLFANESGWALYKKPFKVWSNSEGTASFNSTFVLNIFSGQGLAFILTGNNTPPENSGGKWLGIVNEDTVSSTKSQIVAVEFLTGNITTEDLDGSHVDLNLNGYLKREKPLSVNISADKDVEVRVESDGEALRVFVGKNKSTPVISDSLSLSYYLPQRAYVGFSASTGDNTQLSCVTSWEFSASDLDEDHRNLKWIWIIVSAVIALFIGLALSLYWKWKSYVGKGDDTGLELQIEGSSTAPRKFRLKEVEAATANFNSDNLLGRGGFWTVYKGVLENREVAVKRFSRNSHDDKQDFIAEVTTISSLHHRNLVKLVGWFHERNELILVYEFMPNKSLDKLIFCSKRNHRDIKASNVLLDSEFNARLGDFGLARTINPSDQTHHSTKAIAGTPGYMAPESLLVGRATVQTDVYAFGILVLEVVCGRKPGNQSLQNNYNNSIVDWVWENYRRGSILDVLDLQLNRVFVKEEAECVLMLALACCHPNPNHRPSMRIALRVRAGEVAPPVIPMDRPAFVWPPAMPPSSNEDLEDYSFSGDQNIPSSELIGRGKSCQIFKLKGAHVL